MVDGTEAAAGGNHDDALVSLIDLMLLWSVLCLSSATLADLRVAGWLHLDWLIVLAPALLPLVVFLTVALVALSSDLLADIRASRR